MIGVLEPLEEAPKDACENPAKSLAGIFWAGTKDGQSVIRLAIAQAGVMSTEPPLSSPMPFAIVQSYFHGEIWCLLGALRRNSENSNEPPRHLR